MARSRKMNTNVSLSSKPACKNNKQTTSLTLFVHLFMDPSAMAFSLLLSIILPNHGLYLWIQSQERMAVVKSCARYCEIL